MFELSDVDLKSFKRENYFVSIYMPAMGIVVDLEYSIEQNNVGLLFAGLNYSSD